MPAHEHFADSMQAKGFLVSRIVEEAHRQNQPLSDLEEKMLYFSETCPTLSNTMEIAERFEEEIDSGKYEDRICRLAKSAYRHDSQESPENTRLWKEAIRVLKEEDHYILVMLRSLETSSFPPKATTNKDQWRLLGYGLLTASLMALFAVPILIYDKNFPKLAVEAILAAIAGAVYWLSRYMERRKK
jgi:hypothetical protein